MHKNFSRAFTALALVFSLCAGSLTALAVPQTQATGQKPETAQTNDKTAKVSDKGKAATTAGAQPASGNKTLSTKDDPSLIGKRNINKGIIAKISGGVDKEVALGRQLAAEVDRTAKFVDDPVITEYINRVGQNVVLHSDAKVPFTIKVIDSDEVNAFALPGGFFYVNKGLILAADNEAEVAGVMAHEIAHVAARHAMENQAKGMLADIGLTVGSIFLGGLGGMAILNGAQFGALLGFMKFSRSAESEADALGVQYLYAAGYDPSAMSTMFEKLATKNKKKPGTMSKLFSTHPQSIDRMETSRALVARFPEREEYVVSTSEFQRVKNRLL
ncbi:MAG: M48 family metallopeptidase, partial [Pyrinomonadaceae bacterium]